MSSDYFGYIEAIHHAAAKSGASEYIADVIDLVGISVWDLIHFFEDDVSKVIKVGLYEQLHTPSKPFAKFHIISCRNGCYRLPTEKESEFLNGKKTIPARSSR